MTDSPTNIFASDLTLTSADGGQQMHAANPSLHPTTPDSASTIPSSNPTSHSSSLNHSTSDSSYPSSSSRTPGTNNSSISNPSHTQAQPARQAHGPAFASDPQGNAEISKGASSGDDVEKAARAPGKDIDNATRDQGANFPGLNAGGEESKEEAMKESEEKSKPGVMEKVKSIFKGGGAGEAPEGPSYKEMYEKNILPHAQADEKVAKNEAPPARGGAGVVGVEDVMQATRADKEHGLGPRKGAGLEG